VVEMAAAKRAVLYLRLSSVRKRDGQLDDTGLEAQERLCRELCERRGYRIVSVITDLNKSASVLHGVPRAGYAELLNEWVDQRRCDVVVVRDTARFSRRKVYEVLSVIERLSSHGVELDTAEDGPQDVSTPSGELTAGMMAAIRGYQAREISEHVKERLRTDRLAGKAHHGRRGYGFRWSREAQTWMVEPAEAGVIRDAYTWIMRGGSAGAFVRDLNERGVPATDGSIFRLTRFLDALRSPTTIGMRDPVAPGKTWAPRWEHILTHEEQQLLVVELAHRTQRDTREPRLRRTYRARLLNGTGLLHCTEHPDVPMTLAGHRERRGYECTWQGCGIGFNSGAIEDYVWDAVTAEANARLLFEPDAETDAGSAAEITPLIRERHEVEARLVTLAERWANGTLDDISWGAAGDRLRAQLADVATRLAAAGGATLVDWAGPRAVGARAMLRATELTDLELASRRSAICELIERVDIGRTSGHRATVHLEHLGRDVCAEFSRVAITWKGGRVVAVEVPELVPATTTQAGSAA
jgi:DNA invertase Pin-like site-specific DNA recombinase